VNIVLLVCTSESADYQLFFLNSSFVSSIASTQIPALSKNTTISTQKPLELKANSPTKLNIHLSEPYMLMLVLLEVTSELKECYARLTADPQQVPCQIIFKNNSIVVYSVKFLSTEPSKQVSLTILSTRKSDISKIQLAACTGMFLIIQEANVLKIQY
jgi:hypothetical protein